LYLHYANWHLYHTILMTPITTASSYAARIKKYFRFIQGVHHTEVLPAKGAKDKFETTAQKVWDREAEPATISGLALFLGFNSRQEFDTYERNGEFACEIKRGRLMIEAEYEKKLHYQSPTGAIFVLKSLGWTERPDGSQLDEIPKIIQMEIVDSGPQMASSEKEVSLRDDG
jgi:hypothetical protein